MKQYLALLQDVVDNGVDRGDRTGTGTRSVFGRQLRFDLSQGFPLVTTKTVHLKSVIVELLWLLQGRTDVQWLQERGCRTWNEWADAEGDLGPVYGKQWRSWACPEGGPLDQIGPVVEQIKSQPLSRRPIVSGWHPADGAGEGGSPQEHVAKGRVALAACHTLFQFYAAQGRLARQLHQRSAGLFLGGPYNIASYALLTHMIVQLCD